MRVLRNCARIGIVLLIMACTEKKVEHGEVAIIPLPSELVESEGYFTIDSKTKVAVENEVQANVAKLFFSEFNAVSGWEPEVQVGGDAAIKFVTKANLEEEAYTLEVSPEQIEIGASSGAGFFYALQSLKQLMPVSFYGGETIANVAWAVPSVKIADKPAFGWRGYMLDVSRHFFDVDDVKRVLDFMAESKLNRFHWHLADDQGWRIEIKSYPKLTEVGAWRVDHNTTDENVNNWWGRPVPKPGEKPTYGGFYTQEQVKEIVAYAKERFIEVIPEIDMPGHAQATIVAYPEIGCVDADLYVATGGVYRNNTYNPGKEETFEFAEKMLNEVMDLFPYPYLHIGGDECNKSQWKKDPFAQQRIKDEGLKDVYELQSYFIKRIEKIINARGYNMIGWDEILEGGLAPNATVMSWRGEKGGLESMEQGHDVIMTPNTYCYIDLKQGQPDMEPNIGYGQLLLSTSYGYKIVPEGLTAEEAKRILGIQANMWTESIADWGKLTYMTFPRLYAIAETGWTPQDDKNWDDFTKRLDVTLNRLDAQGVRYATSAYSPWIKQIGKEGNIEVNIKTEVNGLDIHYTTDGSEPTLESPKYTAPFTVDQSVTVKARAFQNGEAMGYLATKKLPIHLAANIKSDDQIVQRLTDLNYGTLDRGDANWVHFKEGMEVVLEFEEPKTVKNVSLNTLKFSISAVYPPETVEVYGSTDGVAYTLLGSEDQTQTSLVQGRNRVPFNIPLKESTVKYLKIKGKEINPVPEGHHKVGVRSVIYVDEIVVD